MFFLCLYKNLLWVFIRSACFCREIRKILKIKKSLTYTDADPDQLADLDLHIFYALNSVKVALETPNT